ncbi:hypothetical protein [Nocardia sp. NBC_01009]|uniref:hypothetical protein n=1 Tax=Nocardia sp. NBC_01009 TaxID=2975996 RepID=UPI0038637A0A|nr:hypothetical protein OHA42_23455 [Nocardia sp. NBC_01009]
MTFDEGAGGYPDVRWGRVTSAMPAANGYPADNILDDNPSTFYLSAETPPTEAAITIALHGRQIQPHLVVLELGDGAGNYLWPKFEVWYSTYGEPGWWGLFGRVEAGVQRIEIAPSGLPRVMSLKLVTKEPGAHPVAVRMLDLVNRNSIPTALVTAPNPLPVSTFDELQYGRLRFTVGPSSGSDVPRCTGIAIRVPVGRQAGAIADHAASARGSVYFGDTGVHWTPLAPDLSDPDLAVFRFVPDSPDVFDNTRRAEFTISGLDMNGAPGRALIGVEQVVVAEWEAQGYLLTRSQYEIEKVANEFYVHGFRPASTVVDYNQPATLLWNGVRHAKYTISYRDSTGTEQTVEVSGGSWTSPPLTDATNFTLTATRGGHVRYLTTHIEVGRRRLTFADFTVTENIAAVRKVMIPGGGYITVGSPVVANRDVTVEKTIDVAGSATLGDSLTVTGSPRLFCRGMRTEGDVEVVGSLDARQGIRRLHGTPQVFTMRSGIEQTFTPPTDGYVMVSVTRHPSATGEARIGSEGATVWASPPPASGAPKIRSAILPVRKNNLTTVKYQGSGSSSATLLWIPLGTGTISGVG